MNAVQSVGTFNIYNPERSSPCLPVFKPRPDYPRSLTEQHAVQAINGVSPREPNPRLGCEMLKAAHRAVAVFIPRGINLGLTTTMRRSQRYRARDAI